MIVKILSINETTRQATVCLASSPLEKPTMIIEWLSQYPPEIGFSYSMRPELFWSYDEYSRTILLNGVIEANVRPLEKQRTYKP